MAGVGCREGPVVGWEGGVGEEVGGGKGWHFQFSVRICVLEFW